MDGVKDAGVHRLVELGLKDQAQDPAWVTVLEAEKVDPLPPLSDLVVIQALFSITLVSKVLSPRDLGQYNLGSRNLRPGVPGCIPEIVLLDCNGWEPYDENQRAESLTQSLVRLFWAVQSGNMFDLDDLEHVDPSPMEVSFDIQGDVYSMRCPNVNLTPQTVMQKWERDLGVTYATRIRFLAPSEQGYRTLNARADALPFVPAVVKLEGPGSVLTALAVALKRRNSGAGASGNRQSGPQEGAAKAAPAKKAGLGPVQRSVFRQYQADMHRKIAEAEEIEAAVQDQQRRKHEEFLRAAEAERKDEAARWAQEEAEWASRRRTQRKPLWLRPSLFLFHSLTPVHSPLAVAGVVLGRLRVTESPTTMAMNRQRQSRSGPGEARPASRPDGPDINKDRLTFCLASLIGHKVTASLRNNVMYEGTFHSCALDSDYSITLKTARRLPSESNNKSGEVIDMLVISGKDFLQVSAMNVPPPSRESEGRKGFATDAEISGSPEGGMMEVAALLLPRHLGRMRCRSEGLRAIPARMYRLWRRELPDSDGQRGRLQMAWYLRRKHYRQMLDGSSFSARMWRTQKSWSSTRTPEGFVDHEFPAQARSIDGLQGPAVRRGQETLMELLKTVDQEED
eukprot:s549_g13.t1